MISIYFSIFIIDSTLNILAIASEIYYILYLVSEISSIKKLMYK